MRMGLPLALILLWAAEATAAEKPDEVRRVYLAVDDHTDYMWSGDEAAYRQAFLQTLDYYLHLADKTEKQGLPHDHQSRFNCDGSFWVWEYEHHKPKADFERLMRRVRSGHITVPLNPLCCCWGGAPLEATIRGMYYAGSLERRFDLRLPLVIAMENQTHPYGLASVWAGSGARYSWKGICNCATRVPGCGDREHPVYWLRGPDGSRILMKWYPMRGNQSLGGYAEARRPEEAVRLAETAEWFTSRHPYRVIGIFGKGWDDLKTMTDELVHVARRLTNDERQVIVSNEVDYFVEFEKRYGNDLPEQGCSHGNEWDVLPASMAEVSARVKRAVEKLRAAEAMAAVVSLQRPGFAAAMRDQRNRAWIDLGLYYEHDWCANGPVPREKRAAWQRRVEGRITAYVDRLHERAATALAGMVGGGEPAKRFVVFNPLGWARTDAVFVPCATSVPGPHLLDLATGREVPSQPADRDGRKGFLILASDVPALGYKVYALRAGGGKRLPDAAKVVGRVMETDRYLVEVAPRGAIISLFDKQHGREWAAEVEGLAINDLGPGAGRVRTECSGPVCATLVAESGEPLEHTTRVTLYRGVPRIDVENVITQNFTDVRTWGFAFKIEQPDVRHEEVGAIARARLLADGGHYSPKAARYDWMTLNHFAAMSGVKGAGVTLSNADCMFFRLGRSTTERLDARAPLIRVLAGGQVDGPGLGIRAQDGDERFLQRFALATCDEYDAACSMRMALEHQNPLFVLPPPRAGAAAPGGARLPAARFGLLAADNPRVIVWAVKPAEEGIAAGLIVRLWNVTDQPQHTAVALPKPIRAATETTHIETDRRPAPLRDGRLFARLKPQQIATFRLMPGSVGANRLPEP